MTRKAENCIDELTICALRSAIVFNGRHIAAWGRCIEVEKLRLLVDIPSGMRWLQASGEDLRFYRFLANEEIKRLKKLDRIIEKHTKAEHVEALEKFLRGS